MSSDTAIDLMRESLVMILTIAAPVLGLLLITGLLVGAMQSMTNIHDPTVSIVPRLAVGGIALLALLPWIIDRLSEYSAGLFVLGGS